MFLFVGLGNPGAEYAATRHNIGWMVLQRTAVRWSIVFDFHDPARLGKGQFGSHSIALALPNSWMNQTGFVVRRLIDELEVSPNNLIVVHDDLDLDLGSLRIKVRGGAGGHNGIRSIHTCLESQKFIRLKVGIGRPPVGESSTEYVLSPFRSEEAPLVDEVLSQAVDALECLVDQGASETMNRFNVRRKE